MNERTLTKMQQAYRNLLRLLPKNSRKSLRRLSKWSNEYARQAQRWLRNNRFSV